MHGMKFQDGAYFDSGPRPTPTIRDGKVFVHNTDGYLVCLGLQDGKKIWSQNAKAQFKSSATWHGCVSSPLVTEKAVFLQIGGSNAAVVAFAPESGNSSGKPSMKKPALLLPARDVRWQATTAGCQSQRAAQPGSGDRRESWSRPTRKQSSGNVYCASPIVFGDNIFLSAGIISGPFFCG